MMNNYFFPMMNNSYSSPFPVQGGFVFLMMLLGIWELVWKGMGLWRAARNSQQNWFVAILLINSLGILPIIYLKFYAKSKKKR